jgi:leucyl aminopeptidase (aminopeptidase T)
MSIEGGEGARLLKRSLNEKSQKSRMPVWGIKKIGEIGIGLNPNASIVGTTIIDEKVLGTAHVALGSNYWFMGRVVAPLHLDQVFRDVEIFLNGKKVDVNRL